jgi:hypothetical protein
MEWCLDNGYSTNWSVKAGDQVQTLVQFLPPTEGGLLNHHVLCCTHVKQRFF